MLVSAVSNLDGDETHQSAKETAANGGIADDKSASNTMPWSDIHAWALRDNLPRYTRFLPGNTPINCALWRTMMQEVPELSGYPIEFLREKCEGKVGEGGDEANNAGSSAPGVLPFLDDFYFEPSGGLSGQIYGVPGLKDGTMIETSPVGQVEVTIPLGYVLTEGGGVAYELGKPAAAAEAASLDGIARTASQAAGSLGKHATSSLVAMRSVASSSSTEEDPNSILVRLGASTGLLLVGATAMSMLSHHLTVNVFWV